MGSVREHVRSLLIFLASELTCDIVIAVMGPLVAVLSDNMSELGYVPPSSGLNVSNYVIYQIANGNRLRALR